MPPRRHRPRRMEERTTCCEAHVRLESAERVGSPSIPAYLDAREAASPPSTLGGDDEASHPCRERLREKALPAATDPGRPPNPGRPSAPPASLQEPGGARAHHAVQLWSVDVGEARAASGPRFRTHGVAWRPSGCPIWEPSGSPPPRPERLSSLRPERHPALPPGTDEPSGCHGSLVGGAADPGPRALLLKAAAPAVADCLVVCPLDTRG